MSQKNVVYIDIEDDITAIIEKAVSSKTPITALVLPKRYAVLQSLVNMKLLKKAADKVDKKVVLITAESTLLPVAGMAGVHVADTLQSRPAVPKVEPTSVTQEDTVIDESDQPEPEVAASEQSTAKQSANKDSAKNSKNSAGSSKKSKKNKDAAEDIADSDAQDPDGKIPNFDRFKKKIIIGVGIFILLIIGWIFAYIIMPKAEISISAQTTRVDTNLDITLDPNATSDNIDQRILVAGTREIKKTESQKFEATGEKNVGEKATGTIDVTNNCFNPGTLPQGTVFTAASGLKFVSTEAVNVPMAIPIFGDCSGRETTASVPVVAEARGDNYNLAPTSYTIGGYPASAVTGYGSQMSGGTSKIISVVTQGDVNKATKALLEKKNEDAINELREQFEDGTFVIEKTFTANNGTPVSQPAIGAEADQAELRVEFIYKVMGVKQESLEQILEKDQLSKVSSEDQSILKNGLEEATFTIADSANKKVINIKTNGYAGPEINIDSLKDEIKGKRYGEVVSIIKSKAGVRDVNVDFSPFWVFSAPGRTSKINISIEVSDTLQ